MPSYSSHGDRLQYDERGEGVPVVVLGGGPARHPDYLGDLGGLGRRLRLVVPHLRGIGGSPLPDDRTRASWWSQAEDVEALREHLGLAALTVLGHSAGCRIALAYATRFPDSLERLVLVTPPASGLVEAEDDVQAIRARRTGEPAFDAALSTALQGPPADADDDALNAWQRSIAPLSYARWDDPQRRHAATGPWSVRAVAAYDSVPVPPTFTTDLAWIAAPVRVVTGGEDGIVGTAAPTALAGVVPDGAVLQVEGAGHYPWVDRPEEFAAAASDALAG